MTNPDLEAIKKTLAANYPSDVTDLDQLANRMFDRSTETVVAGQAGDEMTAEHYRMATRQRELRGGAVSQVPFNVFLPPELEEHVEKWRATLQAAQDADAHVVVAENKLTQARNDAIAAQVDNPDAPVPDLNDHRAEIDRAQIVAEAKYRTAMRANSDMRRLVQQHYPAWRAAVVEHFHAADSALRDALIKLRQADTVRDDMIKAVIDLDDSLGKVTRMENGDPARHPIYAASQRRPKALETYAGDLLKPTRFDPEPPTPINAKRRPAPQPQDAA